MDLLSIYVRFVFWIVGVGYFLAFLCIVFDVDARISKFFLLAMVPLILGGVQGFLLDYYVTKLLRPKFPKFFSPEGTTRGEVHLSKKAYRKIYIGFIIFSWVIIIVSPDIFFATQLRYVIVITILALISCLF